MSREFETRPGQRNDLEPIRTDADRSKEEVLRQAKISEDTAERCEQLSAYNEETKPIFEAAAETYLAKANQNGQAPSYGGLKEAIRSALIASGMQLPKRKPKSKRPELEPRDHRLINFTGRIHDLAERQENFDPEYLVSEVIPQLAGWHLEACVIALERISAFKMLLERRFRQ